MYTTKHGQLSTTPTATQSPTAQGEILDALAKHGAFYLQALAPPGGTKTPRYNALHRAAKRLEQLGKIVVMRNCAGPTRVAIALAGVVPGTNSPFGGCQRYTDVSPAELEENSAKVRGGRQQDVKRVPNVHRNAR